MLCCKALATMSVREEDVVEPELYEQVPPCTPLVCFAVCCCSRSRSAPPPVYRRCWFSWCVHVRVRVRVATIDSRAAI